MANARRWLSPIAPTGAFALALLGGLAFVHLTLHHPTGLELAVDSILGIAVATWIVARTALGPRDWGISTAQRRNPSTGYRDAEGTEMDILLVRSRGSFGDAAILVVGVVIAVEMAFDVTTHFMGLDLRVPHHAALALSLVAAVGIERTRETRLHVVPARREVVVHGQTFNVPPASTLRVERPGAATHIVILPAETSLYSSRAMRADHLFEIATHVASALGDTEVVVAPALVQRPREDRGRR